MQPFGMVWGKAGGGGGNETDADRLADMYGHTLGLKNTEAKQPRLVSMIEINNIVLLIFADNFHCISLDEVLTSSIGKFSSI